MLKGSTFLFCVTILFYGAASHYNKEEDDYLFRHSLLPYIRESCIWCCLNPDYLGGIRICDPVDIPNTEFISSYSAFIADNIHNNSSVNNATNNNEMEERHHLRDIEDSNSSNICLLEEKSFYVVDRVLMCYPNQSHFSVGSHFLSEPSSVVINTTIPPPCETDIVSDPSKTLSAPPSQVITHSTEYKNFVVIDPMDNVFESFKPTLSISESKKDILARIDLALTKSGAVGISKSKGMSSADSVLTTDKYKYSLSECKKNKWFIFSLSEMVVIDHIATANFERFSSSIKEFVVYSSQVYPTISWSFIGYFMADDNSEVQVFPIHCMIWAKYIKVEWLTHYRDETICTMSEFRIYGSNMMSTIMQADFSKPDSRTANLKEILSNAANEEENTDIVKKDDMLSSHVVSTQPTEQDENISSQVLMTVSPEFKPIYELYSRCAQEQKELTFSVALLHNKTKVKIHSIKNRISSLEEETLHLNEHILAQSNEIQQLQDSLMIYQLDVKELREMILRTQSAFTVLAFAAGCYFLYKSAKRWLRLVDETPEEKQIREMKEELKKSINELRRQYVTTQLQQANFARCEEFMGQSPRFFELPPSSSDDEDKIKNNRIKRRSKRVVDLNNGGSRSGSKKR